MYSILFRTIILYVFITLVIHGMGKRQLGELEMSDFVTTILLSQIISLPIEDPSIPLSHVILPILIIVSLEIMATFLKGRFNPLKRIFEAKPTFLAEHGVINQRELLRVRITLDELLSNPEIDAVSVCTANSTHRDVTISALRHGKHVLCEKPMAATLEECNDMADAARTEGKWLMIAHNQRFCTTHKRAKELLEAGAIGRPLSFCTTFGHSGPDNWSIDAGTSNWFFDKAKSCFGVVADLGVHKIDLVRYLLGCDVAEISATLATLDKKYANGDPVDVEDNAILLCRMENYSAASEDS